MSKTINEVSAELRESLIEYIEATYHIGDPALLTQRRALLEELGVVHQTPYLESTPRYKTGRRFSEIKGLNPAALELFETLARPTEQGNRILYDPPYTHQSAAIAETIVGRSNLLIMTGTGSGKTESFLMPILGKLAREASQNPGAFETQSGMRALILYPMNALVNDQLGRLRGIFGDPRLVKLFTKWANRPPRFARYTSRTPYAGVRSKGKDQRRLKQFGDFYVGAIRQAKEAGAAGDAARKLIADLSRRGKWPAKPDLEAWYQGPTGRYWQDAKGNFIRAVTLPQDSELITRHESQAAAPDLLVTNYSMLEYMLMRPVERTIFDQTREWLARNPTERFLLILDESHLYRGAGGAEVGLLLRRLRDRLDIPVDRFQVICATASFECKTYAPTFASELTGTPASSFVVIDGDLLKREGEATGSTNDANLLANLDMPGFYGEDPVERGRAVEPFLRSRGEAVGAGEVDHALHRSLETYAPLALLVNQTMGKALGVESLGQLIFPASPKHLADQALTNLGALASNARLRPEDPSLLPCRVHNFFRGLRGLWACMDRDCTAIHPDLKGVVGKLYTQPRDICECNARVLELFTCRVCGTAYARGYCDNPETPKTVWSEPGAPLRVAGESLDELTPLDILLVEPGRPELAEMVTFDLTNAQINSATPGLRERIVYLSPNRVQAAVQDDDDDGAYIASAGIFHECGVCERKSFQGRSSVQDHETKGDQPFQVLLNRQLQVQPPGPQVATKFAPLRGRKVLAFSDSRQVAARLAPNLQMFSARDSLRPLMVRGWTRLARIPKLLLRIEDIYPAVLLAANELDVRLRPELSLQEIFSDYTLVGSRVSEGILDSDEDLKDLCQEIGRGDGPPESLLADIMSTLRDRSLGLEALAVASIVERDDRTKDLAALPDIPGVTELPEDRIALARAWLREWNTAGFWLPMMKQRWYLIHPDRKVRVNSLSGKFQKFERRLPTPAAKKVFKEKWIPELLRLFAEKMDGKFRLQGQFLSLKLGGDWVRCTDCKSVHRPVRLLPVCLDCGHRSVLPLNPETDDVFLKRKGYYRKGILAALADNPEAPVSIIAAEHTAQLNSAEQDDVFSKAEENELLFQDVEIPDSDRKSAASAIDVLSSTTTMEVGIDIGQLSGVALRNMPPSRANYQQRAGRAGRRGNAIATVIAYGGSDTHDEHFFSKPAEMIAGQVVDPTLSLDNPDIAKRHIRAFLLQSYHQAKIPVVPPGATGNLFSVLGKVGEFLTPSNVLSRVDFERWLNANAAQLRARISNWMPVELSAHDRQALLEEMIQDCLDAIDLALTDPERPPVATQEGDETQYLEVQPETDEEKPASKADENSLLDTLLYKGVLPRYAFPTDVATFHVFDVEGSTRFRPKLKFGPSQGLPVALSQYAPGKQVWISGKCYTSGAIYSPVASDRFEQWQDRRLHLECSRCGFAFTREVNFGIDVNQIIDCEACEGEQSLGPARYWMRPTGFAHPVDIPEVTSPDDLPETSYATRAKLTLKSPADADWTASSERIRHLSTRTHLLVSNTGPSKKGYSYCTKCGRIEATTAHGSQLMGPHKKPYPDPQNPNCEGGYTSQGIVLGTDFVTDVALFSLRLAHPLRLRAADSITKIALRTLSEALARAATDLLEIEPGEVMAEFRPAVTPLGIQGLETEIFLYDTLAGGAGFSKEAAKKGVALFERALAIMRNCEEKCDLSCYRCLRSFRNRIDHGSLDRFTGIALAEYLLTGTMTPFESKRLSTANALLFTDLLRHEKPGVTVARIADVTDTLGDCHHEPLLVESLTGARFVVCATNPLKELSGAPVSGLALPDGRRGTLLEINELLIRKNLPQATQTVIEMMR